MDFVFSPNCRQTYLLLSFIKLNFIWLAGFPKLKNTLQNNRKDQYNIKEISFTYNPIYD